MSFRHFAAAALIALGAIPGAALAQDMSGMDMSHQASASQQPASSMPGMDMPDDKPGAMADMDMMPPLRHGWMIMTHGAVTLAADSQSGPRGGDKTFAEGMVMVMASHAFDGGNDIELDMMLSPDPFMGKSGYPLLLQTGETADGVHPLRDRQHPHDLFMGLSATLTHHMGEDGKAFLTLGYPGETAFGPTAFMHRASGEDFPTAPISHHWLDAGHITMGVVTAGYATGPFQVEVSRFTGREPDQARFNLDPVRLDSTAVRLTWAMTPHLKGQASWAHQISPEQLEPDVNLDKRSLSLEYTRRFAAMTLDTTLAYGWRKAEHGTAKAADAWLLENRLRFSPQWEGLLRYERVYNDELASRAWWVGKTEIGAVRTFEIGRNTTLGLGAVQQFNTIPAALKTVYGAHPTGTVAFLTLKFHGMAMTE